MDKAFIHSRDAADRLAVAAGLDIAGDVQVIDLTGLADFKEQSGGRALSADSKPADGISVAAERAAEAGDGEKLVPSSEMSASSSTVLSTDHVSSVQFLQRRTVTPRSTQLRSGALRRPAKSNSLGILIILLAMCLLLTIAVGKKFLSASNLISVIRQFSFYGILAIGMCMVIITAGIDLSVGSVFALAGVLSCMAITKWHLPVFVGVLIGLAVGVLMGYFNGVCVTLLKLPPMIATLGTMSIARGIAYTVTGGYPIGSLPDSYKFLGLGYIAGIPTPIVLMVVLAALTIFFLNKTVVGRWIYAIGGNEEGARISGVRVNRVKRLVYSLSGLMAAISGIAMAARLGVGQSTAGQSYEMDAIAATVIGGASLSGGSGSIVGAIIGAAIMGVLRNGLVLLDVSAYWQQTVIGAVIILAVALDNLRHMKKKA